jgi:hypothetical protein
LALSNVQLSNPSPVEIGRSTFLNFAAVLANVPNPPKDPLVADPKNGSVLLLDGK